MTTYEGQLRGDGLRLAIAASRFNDFITERLLAGARDCLVRHGVDETSITVAWAPGAFELPLVAYRLAASGEYDAVICVGAVIRGATGHYDGPETGELDERTRKAFEDFAAQFNLENKVDWDRGTLYKSVVREIREVASLREPSG